VPTQESRSPDQKPPLWAVLIALVAFLLRPAEETDRRPDVASGTQRDLSPLGNGARQPGSEEGRDAVRRRPSDIPRRGWKDILWHVYHNIPEHRVISIAAGVTFYVLLAIFPGIAALVAIYGLFADPSSIGQHPQRSLGRAAWRSDGGARRSTHPADLPAAEPAGLCLFFGVAVSLWSANAGVKALFDALNVVYSEREQRSFLRLNAISLAFTFGAIVFMVVTLSAIAVLPLALGYLGLLARSNG